VADRVTEIAVHDYEPSSIDIICSVLGSAWKKLVTSKALISPQ